MKILSHFFRYNIIILIINLIGGRSKSVYQTFIVWGAPITETEKSYQISKNNTSLKLKTLINLISWGALDECLGVPMFPGASVGNHWC